MQYELDSQVEAHSSACFYGKYELLVGGVAKETIWLGDCWIKVHTNFHEHIGKLTSPARNYVSQKIHESF